MDSPGFNQMSLPFVLDGDLDFPVGTNPVQDLFLPALF